MLFGRIAKKNPVYEMVPSVPLSIRLRQQFGLALAFHCRMTIDNISFKLHMKIDLYEFYPMWPLSVTLTFKGSKFEGQICYWCLNSLYVDHVQ